MDIFCRVNYINLVNDSRLCVELKNNYKLKYEKNIARCNQNVRFIDSSLVDYVNFDILFLVFLDNWTSTI